MFSLRKVAAMCALLAIGAPATTLAADSMSGHMMSGHMSDQIKPMASRFSGPGVYVGQPALPVTLSMVIAGGGPDNFKSTTLIKTLTGPKFDAEVGKLTKQYGKDKVGSFLTVFDYVVDDSLRIVKAKKIALPSTPNPDPKDGQALATALWNAGQTGNGFNVEVMLDRAVSHPIHVQVMDDIDKKFGVAADATYHAILTSAMQDLASVYSIK
ncbi:MAG: hypothetical protein JO165_13065 [Candidatus Eremiobacteraeota bacterium]|nr:hypothetical protein [Candidatus Eremiobacteraeota bacterium]